jgi:hypothetical protein
VKSGRLRRGAASERPGRRTRRTVKRPLHARLRVVAVETAGMSQTGCGVSGRGSDGLPLPGLRPDQPFFRCFAKGHFLNIHPPAHSDHVTSRRSPPRCMPIRTPSLLHLRRTTRRSLKATTHHGFPSGDETISPPLTVLSLMSYSGRVYCG